MYDMVPILDISVQYCLNSFILRTSAQLLQSVVVEKNSTQVHPDKLIFNLISG